MPDSDPTLSATRRRAAQHQRRQTRKRVLGTASAVIVIVIAALWFSDTLRIPTQGPSLAAGVSTDRARRVGGDNPGSAASEPKCRSLNPLQPLRLWIAGDSLAGALGPSLGKMTAVTGVVQPQYDSRVGTGLSSTGSMNWPEHATEQLKLLDPETVVFMIGTNDAVIYDDSAAAAYRQLTENMMRILVGNGREVYWVNAPVMRESGLEDNVLKVDEIQREVAAEFPDNVILVDAHTLFADDKGEYQSSLPNEDGKKVTMRAGDGIHLTGAGGDHLGTAIFKLIDARCHIVKQAVLDQPKKVLVTRGSTQVGGSGSGSSSSSGSSSGSSSNSWRGSSGSSSGNSTTQTTATSQTTTPTTAAPPPPSTTPTTSSTPPTSSSTPPST